MFDRPFAHYLTYGSTDQQTVRQLHSHFDGLMVPGTVAALQYEGTGGFVLSLSAAGEVPYSIDPRFPLFQEGLGEPKKSHEALAERLGARDELITGAPLDPGAFTPALVDTIASHWADLNSSYSDSAKAKFDKYAARLGEEAPPDQAMGPELVLPPYLACTEPTDAWWEISTRLFDRTRAHLSADQPCVRVVLAKEARQLDGLLSSCPVGPTAIWVSGLDELRTLPEDLADYTQAIIDATAKGRPLFALYGGFFSVVLSNAGLRGACHGIGFGEYRAYVELPRSGPPPPRYYLPRIHRYVSQELAFALWRSDEALAYCDCDVCQGRPPIALDYHPLMMHSVLCRAREIAEWTGVALTEAADRIEQERRQFVEDVRRSEAPTVATDEAFRNVAHLELWVNALRQL